MEGDVGSVEAELSHSSTIKCGGVDGHYDENVFSKIGDDLLSLDTASEDDLLIINATPTFPTHSCADEDKVAQCADSKVESDLKVCNDSKAEPIGCNCDDLCAETKHKMPTAPPVSVKYETVDSGMYRYLLLITGGALILSLLANLKLMEEKKDIWRMYEYERNLSTEYAKALITRDSVSSTDCWITVPQECVDSAYDQIFLWSNTVQKSLSQALVFTEEAAGPPMTMLKELPGHIDAVADDIERWTKSTFKSVKKSVKKDVWRLKSQFSW